MLSESEVSEIEARALEVKGLVGVGRFGEDMLALCQTVRALRVQLERVNSLGEEMLTRLESLAGIGKKADHGWYYVIERVESQLAAVTQERDKFSELADKRHDDLCEARRQRDSLAANHVAYSRDAMTAAVNDFRTHVIKICKDRVGEYNESAKSYKGDDRMRLCLSSKRDAYKDIAQLLEQL